MFEKALGGRPQAATAPVNFSAIPAASSAPSPNGRIRLILLIVFVLLVAIFGVVFYWQSSNQRSLAATTKKLLSVATKTVGDLGTSTVPSLLPTSTVISIDGSTSTLSQQQIEYLSFADFYQAPDNKITVKNNDYKLPLNIKTDVLNYYDFSRKINLDKVLGDLNNQGFAIIDNPFTSEAVNNNQSRPINNFYGVYDTLNKKQIPTLITSDFLTYYYQNLTKKVFKDVETNVFYDDLWDISTQMYTLAKDRYEKRLAAVGDINDSILEGARLETAYFATALEILKPADKQINQKNDLSDQSKFSVQDALDLSFNPPSYLKVDVLKEVQLIHDHNTTAKSPVLLYPRDYHDFSVPEDYVTNAKLNNFYLTTKWLNSVFPVYYQSSQCPNCPLDINDWRIHTVAAGFIAQDLFGDSVLTNEWARIYKTLAFFKGMRGDLTYVNYRDALTSLFGKDYKIEDLFADTNAQMPANFQKLQNQLISYNFTDVEGGLDKNNPATRANLGAKLLSEFYWPNDYIFKGLTYPTVGAYFSKTLKSTNMTACSVQNIWERCLGFGLDVVNLLYPIPTTNNYFADNSNYNNYAAAVKNLQAKINFTEANWHANNFWTTLHTMQNSLIMDKNNWPVFGRQAAWDNREINRALATWVNLQLPLDNFSVYQKTSQADNLTVDATKYYEYAYVEPNYNLINELLANVNMINGFFGVLKLNSEVQSVAVSLSDLSNQLTTMKGLMQKELSSQALTGDDYQFIDKFARAYKVDTNSTKSFRLVGANNQGLTEDISNVKLLLVVQKHGQDLILTAGPIFNYWEKK